MTYSIITPADNADFFAQFKTFVVSAGWTIDAQSDTELYIHSGDKYLGFRLGTITYSTSYSAVFFTCAMNTGYDNTKDYFNQPSSSISNLNTDTLPYFGTTTFTKYLPCIFAPSDITQAAFVGDSENIIISIKRGLYTRDTIIATWLTKAHSFTGGGILTSTQILRGSNASATGWVVDKGTRDNGSFPFCAGIDKIYSRIGGTQFYLNGSFATASGAKNVFLTNTLAGTSNSATIAAVPFSFYPRINLNNYMYTGLNPLITPEFFYAIGNKFCYAGHVSKIKIIGSTNLTHGQILSYGAKEYLVLAYMQGNIADTTTKKELSAFLAVEL